MRALVAEEEAAIEKVAAAERQETLSEQQLLSLVEDEGLAKQLLAQGKEGEEEQLKALVAYEEAAIHNMEVQLARESNAMAHHDEPGAATKATRSILDAANGKRSKVSFRTDVNSDDGSDNAVSGALDSLTGGLAGVTGTPPPPPIAEEDEDNLSEEDEDGNSGGGGGSGSGAEESPTAARLKRVSPLWGRAAAANDARANDLKRARKRVDTIAVQIGLSEAERRESMDELRQRANDRLSEFEQVVKEVERVEEVEKAKKAVDQKKHLEAEKKKIQHQQWEEQMEDLKKERQQQKHHQRATMAVMSSPSLRKSSAANELNAPSNGRGMMRRQTTFANKAKREAELKARGRTNLIQLTQEQEAKIKRHLVAHGKGIGKEWQQVRVLRLDPYSHSHSHSNHKDPTDPTTVAVAAASSTDAGLSNSSRSRSPGAGGENSASNGEGSTSAAGGGSGSGSGSGNDAEKIKGSWVLEELGDAKPVRMRPYEDRQAAQAAREERRKRRARANEAAASANGDHGHNSGDDGGDDGGGSVSDHEDEDDVKDQDGEDDAADEDLEDGQDPGAAQALELSMRAWGTYAIVSMRVSEQTAGFRQRVRVLAFMSSLREPKTGSRVRVRFWFAPDVEGGLAVEAIDRRERHARSEEGYWAGFVMIGDCTIELQHRDRVHVVQSVDQAKRHQETVHKARDEFKRQLTKGEDDDDDESDDDDYTEEDFKVGFLESKYSKKLLTNNNNQTVTADDKTPGAFKKVAASAGAEKGKEKNKPWESKTDQEANKKYRAAKVLQEAAAPRKGKKRKGPRRGSFLMPTPGEPVRRNNSMLMMRTDSLKTGVEWKGECVCLEREITVPVFAPSEYRPHMDIWKWTTPADGFSSAAPSPAAATRSMKSPAGTSSPSSPSPTRLMRSNTGSIDAVHGYSSPTPQSPTRSTTGRMPGQSPSPSNREGHQRERSGSALISMPIDMWEQAPVMRSLYHSREYDEDERVQDALKALRGNKFKFKKRLGEDENGSIWFMLQMKIENGLRTLLKRKSREILLGVRVQRSLALAAKDVLAERAAQVATQRQRDEHAHAEAAVARAKRMLRLDPVSSKARDSRDGSASSTEQDEQATKEAEEAVAKAIGGQVLRMLELDEKEHAEAEAAVARAKRLMGLDRSHPSREGTKKKNAEPRFKDKHRYRRPSQRKVAAADEDAGMPDDGIPRTAGGTHTTKRRHERLVALAPSIPEGRRA